ncbi:MAG: flavoredoxin [Sphaerochaeta sp.]|jgi:flavin reductase (DIM6/NTAB) family NADH-FMN oxidoreductase RutF|nr:flavoredoxin [Sphaerochaeta sp.]MCH3920213.1 flavoredoxin [Sphaerochaeta sp.]MCH3921197.1 flavoredoxin [Sphaerochaeta sp.]MCI2045953.1 flavoredoxin [Sphaerochaeta sp.]MCI2076526.1 flavoredoxin [Sphaerochaeta sp.]
MLESVPFASLQVNPFTMMGKDLMLVTAGTAGRWNTMTAAWGTLGYLWEKPVVIAFVRPSRYTHAFLEAADGFTCSFFPKSYHDKLIYLGTHSGRDGNKTEAVGMVADVVEPDRITFQGASLVFCCGKASKLKMDPRLFLDDSIEPMYQGKDYHDVYVGFVTSVYRDQ